ncbi:mediator of RNA polymerase II transcription subunit 23 isoform X3 [Ricinus communis]|uniref:mediator of RNA polymerase II transcription subunit 23 isoform X3 n=1 Tax=Ricinus communis TaxID=3988 RepID=UPI00201AF665|nr:mediator of RNA polymerase II transcription subunit 23 isoform X3 [Ricinus communis]
MDQNQRSIAATTAASRGYQFQPARAAIIDLFNLYLGVIYFPIRVTFFFFNFFLQRSSRQKHDDSTREPPNKTQKRVLALNRELPPRNEQFLINFEQLQSQFPDQDQLRSVTESVLISLVIQCCNHAPRAEFLLFALRSLCSIGYINWDTFLPSLLSSVSSAEMSAGQAGQTVSAVSSMNSSQNVILPSSSAIPNSSNFQPSNPTSPLASVHGIGSPVQSAIEPSLLATVSPVKSSDISGNGQPSTSRVNLSSRDNAICSLRQLCCKIILTGLEFNLKPATHSEIFHHMLNWLVNWDQRQHGVDESDSASWSLQYKLRTGFLSYLSRPSQPKIPNLPDLANSIQRGSLDWERALRCIRHALRTTPSPDWWKRVLLVAPSYRSPAHGPTPGS